MNKQEKLEIAISFASRMRIALEHACTDQDNPGHISQEEIDENPTEFIHAVANLVPSHLYRALTGDEDLDNLGFNHIANRLCTQYSTGPGGEFSKPTGVDISKE